MPKYYLVYYKCLLDNMLSKFFDLYNSSFINQNGKYVLAEAMSYSNMKKVLKTLLKEELDSFIKPFDVLKPKYYFIIGSCLPKDNVMLKLKDTAYFPTKLDKLLKSDYQIKYLLKEKDIKLDIVQLNTILIDIFNQLFKKQKKEENTIYLMHKRLDCYSMFKIVKSIFGKQNCINLQKEMFVGQKKPLVAINDLIDKYIHNKVALSNMQEFKTAYEEVKQHLKDRNLIA